MKKCIFLFFAFYLFPIQGQNVNNIPNYKMSFDKEFIVIAHRGASGYYPENTMSAFKAAIDMGADMIELDVLLSKDQVPIVFHDEKLDAKTNGKGLVADWTLSELQKLDAGSWFDTKFKNERIPTLIEVLRFCKDKILVNIEIKTEAVSASENEGIEDLVLEMIDELEIEEQVIISSFDYRAIERIEKKKSSIRTALLYERKQSGDKGPLELVKQYNTNAFNFSIKQLTSNWSDQLNSSDVPFFIYTVNDKKNMIWVMETGAKGIFSDKPDVLKRVAEDFFSKN
jgi:glycerophosphoryl diester phosphodiesterase